MGKTKTITTVEEETKPRDPDQTLEEWLAELAADAEVQAIRVFRRNSLGEWSWLRKYDMTCVTRAPAPSAPAEVAGRV